MGMFLPSSSKAVLSFSTLPPHTPIAMPALSPTMTQGNIAQWNMSEGAKVNEGDIIAEIETDKATVGFDSQEEGFLAKILVPAGAQDVAVGTCLGVLCESEADVAAFANYTAPAPAAAAAAAPAAAAAAAAPVAAAAAAAPVAAAATPAAPGSKGARLIGPAAANLLASSGLQKSQIAGTGPGGIITKGDVLAAIASGMKPGAAPPAAAATAATAAAPKAPAALPESNDDFEVIPVTTIRKIIATRLLESKVENPHQYMQKEISMDAAEEFRVEMNKSAGEDQPKISMNDCVVRAVGLALRATELANIRFNDDAPSLYDELETVDVAVAVATPTGLVTPIVRNTDEKSVFQVAADIRELAGRARDNKLKPEEFTGGSFSVSNLGMFGIDSFQAVVNPPQWGILAVGGTRVEAELDPSTKRPKAVKRMTVNLSMDGRAMVAENAVYFLKNFAFFMENPTLLAIEGYPKVKLAKRGLVEFQ